MLHNPETRNYLEVDDRNFFLWEQMTGESTMWDLSLDYYMEYRSLPVDRLAPLVEALRASHLLVETPGGEQAAEGPRVPPSRPATRLERWARSTFQKTVAMADADRFYDALFRRGGRFLFSPGALLFFVAVSVAGLACFLRLEWTGALGLAPRQSLLGHNLAYVLVFSLFVVFVHESAHALTCKLYGRKVLGAGFMFYYGIPAFFVDVTDTWMSDRRTRMKVALAGPASTAVLASAAAVAAALLSPSPAAESLFQMAYLGYLAVLFNLNPLLELDGYYVLEDLLGVNQLREKAFAYLRTSLWGRLRRGEFGREDALLTAFGLLSLAYTVFAVWLALYLWRNHLREIAGSLRTGEDWLALVLFGGLALAAGTALAVGLAVRLLYLSQLLARRLAGRGRKGGGAESE